MTLPHKAILWLLCLAGAAQLALAQELDPEKILVRVLPSAEVFGERFSLGEIAEMDGFDIKAMKVLAAIEVGRSPMPGRSLRLSERLILTRLRPSIDLKRLILHVPDKAHVTRASLRIPGAEIERLVLKQAAADAGANPEDLKQELRGSINDAVLPKGELEWAISPLGRYISPTGDRTYLAVARIDGKDVWRTTVRLKQKVYHEVVIAASPIRRNATIQRSDLKLERRPAGREAAPLPGSIDEVVGKIARRPIGANEAIRRDMFLEPHAVSEGGRVVVLYRTARVSVRVTGVALVGGHVGDFIPVKNLQSGKIVYGVIEGSEIVRVN